VITRELASFVARASIDGPREIAKNLELDAPYK
jgi:hypothetical protein